MSNRKYPCLGTSWDWQVDLERRYGTICGVDGCEAKAKTQQFVEFSSFRGDDLPIWICDASSHTEKEIIAACRSLVNEQA